MDELHDLAVVLAQRRRLGLGHDAGGERLLDASRRVERRHLAGLDALDADALLERLELHREEQRLLQQSQRVRGLERPVDVLGKPLARLGRVDHEACELVPEAIWGGGVHAAARKDEGAHREREQPVPEVAQEPVQLLLGVVEEAAAGPLDDREVFLQAALVLVMLEHHRGEVHAGQHVPEPRRQALLLLQVAAEGEHRHIDREGEGGGEAHDVLVVARGPALDRRAGEARMGERHDEGAHRIRDAEADVREQRAVELLHARGAIGIARRRHLAQHERVAAHRALAEDDEIAGEEIGALDRNGDRHDLVAAAEIVARPEADALAAVHVHGVVGDLAAHLRDVILEHCGGNRGLFPAVDGARGDRARRVHDVGEPGHARDHRLDALEPAHRRVELAADARVGAGRPHRGFRGAGGVGGERDAAPDRELLHEHPPAAAGHLGAADDEVERHEHIASLDGAVLERHVERKVTAADGDARGVARNERAGDADVGLAAQELLGIEHPEREADHGRHRGEGDVALGEVELEPDDLPTLPGAAAHHPGVGNGARVGAGARSGEREARHFFPAREAGQVIALLLLGAVVVEELRGPERVRHRHRGRGGGAAARDLREHARVRVGRELQAPVLLRDDHGEEAAGLEELPHRSRQIGALVGDAPVIEHAAQLLARPVEERSFRGGELRGLRGEQLRPARRAGEQLPVPPHRARVERLLLGL